ncbi:PRC-barrel domain-containing protein [Croceicoccus naphthovorans]|uniref:Uncharacterized protein n=1 Tax=Croceicoccus naphthovorans TaxID=1348774 RepID=A0A0G3XHL6_9SPHN|nr:PRC-barrel domain-containing protein [Croceicoccus naphthovorans]AKM10106.1 hypothetical protein AB433_09175 [Croceicoccus naphthovorans]MBB3991159.1 hypothetical protein [Croceicoccus naphthovorans]
MEDRTDTLSRNADTDRDETHNLIASDKVDGTTVHASDGDKIGHISHVMLGKRNGRVEYAVMSCGGFLGMGEEYRPVPWDALEYDVDEGGYTLKSDKSRLPDAPSYERDREPEWDRDYGNTVYSYYGMTY